MITVASFSKPEEAHLLRMRLESSGIAAWVQDEHLVQMDWLVSNVIGGVRVQIADEDVDAARELLQNDTGVPPDAESTVCPKCGSTSVEYQSFSKRIAFFFLAFFHLPVLIPSHRLRCDRCLHTWPAERPS